MLRLMRLVLSQAPSLLIVPGASDNTALHGILARLLRLAAAAGFEASHSALAETARALLRSTRLLSASAHALIATGLRSLLCGEGRGAHRWRGWGRAGFLVSTVSLILSSYQALSRSWRMRAQRGTQRCRAPFAWKSSLSQRAPGTWAKWRSC